MEEALGKSWMEMQKARKSEKVRKEGKREPGKSS